MTAPVLPVRRARRTKVRRAKAHRSKPKTRVKIPSAASLSRPRPNTFRWGVIALFVNLIIAISLPHPAGFSWQSWPLSLVSEAPASQKECYR